jgi:hypothetical protein
VASPSSSWAGLLRRLSFCRAGRRIKFGSIVGEESKLPYVGCLKVSEEDQIYYHFFQNLENIILIMKSARKKGYSLCFSPRTKNVGTGLIY